VTIENVKKAVERKPFRPFTIGLASGIIAHVPSEDRVALHPNGTTLVVFEPDGSVRVVDVESITELRL
jgi:hypothetical protein